LEMNDDLSAPWSMKYNDRDAIYQQAIAAEPLKERVLYGEDKGRTKVHLLVTNYVAKEDSRSEMERISNNYGKREYFDELIKMCDEIHMDAVLHLVRITDYKEVIDQIPKGAIILALCDGSDVDGVPGPSVTRYLEEKGIPYYGCDDVFMVNTTKKSEMKEMFIANNVATAKFVYVTPNSPLTRESMKHMTFPLFVKASDSYGSIGLSKDSVCHTFEECEKQVQVMQHTFENVIVEEFIDGAEYSLLVIGDSRFPDSQEEVFPPAERVFDDDIPQDERFLSYHLVWELGGEKYKYAAVTKDSDLLMDLAKRAYDCVGGNGFGRIDVRRRDATNEYFVLEVNANCGIGYDSSSAQILKLRGKGIAYLVERVLSIGGNDPSKKSHGNSTEVLKN